MKTFVSKDAGIILLECEDALRNDSSGAKVNAASIGVAWLVAFGIAFASGLSAYAAEAMPGGVESAPVGSELTDDETVQFQLPPPGGGAPTGETAPALPRQLTYEYVYGSESEVTRRKNADLDKRLDDDFTLLKPELNGLVVYRPTNWLETKLGLIIDREMQVQGERTVLLPDGEIESRPANSNSLLVDEALVTIHNVTGPFSFTVGRRNHEDNRHWLYDTSMDVGAVGFRQGRFRAEATYGREVFLDLDALRRERTDRVNTYMLYADYRGFENLNFAGYTIVRDDRSNVDGRGHLTGLRSLGSPVEGFTYWADFAILRGRDEMSRPLRGYGFDIGGTYRFRGVPLNPNITLAYAFGSGDGNADDGTNHQFRQTGLQSNEQKFAGLSEFRRYGETLDPELSNLQILTVGVGFRPFRDTSLDFIYHDYRLNALAEDLRNAGVTAQLNQDATQPSKDVGRALDIVLGFRSMFGIRRLGMDVRAGKFFPGKAFRNELDGGDFVKAETAAIVVVKLWW